MPAMMLFKRMMFLLFLIFFVARVDAAPFQKIEIVDAINKKAVCNDGTPANYYLRDGFGSGTNRWVIWLEGGFPCDTPEGCNGSNINAPDFTITSRVGLVSDSETSNPDFYNANHVVINQCSGDWWSGNRLDVSGSRPVQFRGRKIFQRLIADLKAKSGSNLLARNTEVLLAGGSSGGIGVMVHLDWLAKQLPQAKVKGLNDSGWLPEKSSRVDGLQNAVEQGIPYWKGKPDLSCLRANPTQKSKCYLSTAYEYITTPLFVAESQWDWIFVLNSADPGANEFAKAVRDSLVPVEAAWSPRVLTHVMSIRIIFDKQKIGTVTFKDVLGNWFFDRAGKVKAIKK